MENNPFQWQRTDPALPKNEDLFRIDEPEEEEKEEVEEEEEEEEIEEEEDFDIEDYEVEEEEQPSIMENEHIAKVVEKTTSFFSKSPWKYYLIGLLIAALAFGAWYIYLTNIVVSPRQELNIVLRRANESVKEIPS